MLPLAVYEDELHRVYHGIKSAPRFPILQMLFRLYDSFSLSVETLDNLFKRHPMSFPPYRRSTPCRYFYRLSPQKYLARSCKAPHALQHKSPHPGDLYVDFQSETDTRVSTHTVSILHPSHSTQVQYVCMNTPLPTPTYSELFSFVQFFEVGFTL